jgi:hypothetical protein
MALVASLRAASGRRLNEMVEDGVWPRWLTLSGPTVRLSLATASSGMSLPVRGERMWSRERAEASRWNSGASSMMTKYWLLGV